jgi:hypothetical protein
VAVVLFLINLFFGKLRDLVYSDEVLRPASIMGKCACGLIGFLILLALLRNIRMTDFVKRRVLYGVLCYLFVLGFFYVTSVSHAGVLICDAYQMHKSAEGADFIYHSQFPHQYFYISLIRFFNVFFGNGNYLPYAFMNLACVGVIVVSVSKITDAVFKDNKTTVVLLLLMAVFFPFVHMLYSCSGDLPALALFSASLCAFISKVNSRTTSCAVICILLSVLAVLFKGTFLLHVLLWMLWGIFSLVSQRKVSHFAIPFLCFFTALFAQGQFIRFHETRYVANLARNEENGIGEVHGRREGGPDARTFPHIPKVCFIAMGLQNDIFDPENGRTVEYVTSPKSLNGKWSGIWNGFTVHGYGKLSEKALKARAYDSICKSFLGFIKDPLYAAHFFIRKIAFTWSNSTLGAMGMIDGRPSFWTHDFAWDSAKISPAAKFFSAPGGLGHSGIRNIHEGWKFIVFLFSAVGFFLLSRDRKSIPNPFVPLLAVIPLCGFFFYLFWEALPRYAIPMLLPLAIVAAYGIARCSEADPRKVISRIFSREAARH